MTHLVHTTGSASESGLLRAAAANGLCKRNEKSILPAVVILLILGQ